VKGKQIEEKREEKQICLPKPIIASYFVNQSDNAISGGYVCAVMIRAVNNRGKSSSQARGIEHVHSYLE
jgi:hypothetical protein